MNIWSSGLVLLAISISVQAQDPQVTLEHGGIVEGRIRSTNLGDTVDFMGIPFAQPPIGNLRFKPPKKHEGWDEVLETKAYGPACLQDTSSLEFFPEGSELKPQSFSEDCLTLNVFVPGSSVNANRAEPLAVMVWIYGGGLIEGATSIYPGHSLAASEDVIVVSMNYRVGVFGFLTSGDERIPGNMGLWDQNLALRWVQENIARFGGDPQRVTIFGESAGGWSVSAQMASPKSRGLFKRAITQSGVALSYLERREDVKPQFEIFSLNASCSQEDMRDKVTCLQNADAITLMALYGMGLFRSTLALVVDGDFIPEQLIKLFDDQNIAAIDYMGGVMRDDGDVGFITIGVSVFQLLAGISVPETYPLVYQMAVMSASYYMDRDKAEKAAGGITRKIYDQYFETFDNNMTNLRSALDVSTDFTFTRPTQKSVHVLSTFSHPQGPNAYLYYMTHKGPDSRNLNVDLGPFHADDLGYLFGYIDQEGSLYYDVANEDDGEVARSMKKAWATFAKDGQAKIAETPEGMMKNHTRMKKNGQE